MADQESPIPETPTTALAALLSLAEKTDRLNNEALFFTPVDQGLQQPKNTPPQRGQTQGMILKNHF